MRLLAALAASITLVLAAAAWRHADRAPAPAPATAIDAPSGMVAFFTGACPAGWQPSQLAAGRLLVGASDPTTIGRTVGVALADAEDRTHGHDLAAPVTLPAKAIAAADGGNTSGAAAGAATLTGAGAAATSGLPFVQLTACERP